MATTSQVTIIPIPLIFIQLPQKVCLQVNLTCQRLPITQTMAPVARQHLLIQRQTMILEEAELIVEMLFPVLRLPHLQLFLQL